MPGETPTSVSNAFGRFVTNLMSSLSGKLDVTAPAVSAAKLTAPFSVGITGDATATGQTDGSSALNLTLTHANTGVAPNTYPKVTVDAKGRVTGGAALEAADIPSLDAAKIATGAIPVARGGTGGTDQASGRAGLGIGTMATRNTFISTAEPTSGDGVDGDVWLKYI